MKTVSYKEPYEPLPVVIQIEDDDEEGFEEVLKSLNDDARITQKLERKERYHTAYHLEGLVYEGDEYASDVDIEEEAAKQDEHQIIDEWLHKNLTKVQYGVECDFFIFDAKYYNIQLEVNQTLSGQPGVGDVTKQYLYQLAYRKFVEANQINKVRNCFLMPTEDDGEEGVIKKGSVRMDMLGDLDLEPIQIRQLSAKRMYEFYLAKRKFDIGLLEL